MSISKWAYVPERCDGDVCCGDCDYCPKTNGNMAILNHQRLCNQCQHYREKEETGIYGCESWECEFEEAEP